MKKQLRKFLIITYILNLIGFGGIIINDINFKNVFNNPLGLVLFFVGTLGPGILGILLVQKENKKIFNDISIKPISILFMAFFLLIHFTLYNLLGDFNKININGEFFLRVFLMILLFGIQEIGWINIVYETYVEEKGIYRSMIIVGLYKAIGFLPLVMLPGFLARPESYAYFATLLIGASGMSIYLKKLSGNYLIPAVFIGFLYGIMSYSDLNQGIVMFLIMFLEMIILYALEGFVKKTN